MSKYLNDFIWINPIGGLGDFLMVSGVLKLVVEAEPERRYNLVRRPPYLSILKGHPAIALVGHPPPDASIISTDYWIKEDLGPGNQRPFQILARAFGVATPAPEKLFLPGEVPDDACLHDFIPFAEKNILIMPASDSPRKEFSLERWQQLVAMLRQKGFFVAQVGRLYESCARGAYNLCGLTTPHQLLAVMKKFDLLVTSDNFGMHLAHLLHIPAVVLWGPTDHEVYGYPEQFHLRAAEQCDKPCIGPGAGRLYSTPCTLGHENHCMNRIGTETIFHGIINVLGGGPLL